MGATPANTPSPSPTAAIATNTPSAVEFPFDVATPTIDLAAIGRFEAMLRAAQGPPAIAPLAGLLKESAPGEVQVQYAGVQLANFAAAVTFTNPLASSVTSDIGMEFRSNPATGVRTVILLDSQGYVSAFPAGEPPLLPALATPYDPAPGATNTLHETVVRCQFGANFTFCCYCACPYCYGEVPEWSNRTVSQTDP